MFITSLNSKLRWILLEIKNIISAYDFLIYTSIQVYSGLFKIAQHARQPNTNTTNVCSTIW